MILVDSSVWIDYFNGKKTIQTDWLDSALGIKPIIIGDLILTEVLQGFQSENDFRKAKKILLEFPFMEMVGKNMAIKSAANYRLLRKKGVTNFVSIITFLYYMMIGILTLLRSI